MTCSSCHAAVPAGARFCAACGARIVTSDSETMAGGDETKLASSKPGSPGSKTTTSGWLTSSGSIVAFLVLNFAADAPLTLDSSKIYAGAAWFYIASLALAGAWMARAGQPLFGDSRSTSLEAR
jgi:hypothetical protein